MHDSSPLSSPGTGHSRSPGQDNRAKAPLRPGHVWSIRAKLHLELRVRDLALFNLAIDSKLRGCDLVALRVDDVVPYGYAIERANVRQRKTGRPARFELTEQTWQSLDAYSPRPSSLRSLYARQPRCHHRTERPEIVWA
jgi:integrase